MEKDYIHIKRQVFPYPSAAAASWDDEPRRRRANSIHCASHGHLGLLDERAPTPEADTMCLRSPEVLHAIATTATAPRCVGPSSATKFSLNLRTGSLMDRLICLLVNGPVRLLVIDWSQPEDIHNLRTSYVYYLENNEATAVLALRVYAELCRLYWATAIIGAKQLCDSEQLQ